MRGLFFVVLLVALAGCDRFVEQEAVFVAYNTSGDRVEFVIDGSETHAVGANSSARFTKKVLVPRGAVGSPTTPTVDRTVQVSVAVKNAVTGELTRPTTCSSGAKVIATITYEKSYWGDGWVSCTSSW